MSSHKFACIRESGLLVAMPRTGEPCVWLHVYSSNGQCQFEQWRSFALFRFVFLFAFFFSFALTFCAAVVQLHPSVESLVVRLFTETSIELERGSGLKNPLGIVNAETIAKADLVLTEVQRETTNRFHLTQ
jgi:hypothetical protein